MAKSSCPHPHLPPPPASPWTLQEGETQSSLSSCLSPLNVLTLDLGHIVRVVAKYPSMTHCLFYANDIWTCILFPIWLVVNVSLLPPPSGHLLTGIVHKHGLKANSEVHRCTCENITMLSHPEMTVAPFYAVSSQPVARTVVQSEAHSTLQEAAILLRLTQCPQVSLDLDRQKLARIHWCRSERRKEEQIRIVFSSRL